MNKKIDIHILGKSFLYTEDLKLKELQLKEIENYFIKMKKFTYSSEFDFNEYKLDDMGWGCTIRSGQMLLANLIIISHLSLYKKKLSY